MTGAEHYAEAERLIELARDAGTHGRFMGRVPFGDSSALYDQPSNHPGLDLAYLHLEQAAVMPADAQVHATLALAAAAGSGPADRARAT